LTLTTINAGGSFLASPIDSLIRTSDVLQDSLRRGQQLGVQIYVSQQGIVRADAGVGLAREGVAMTADTVNLWFSSGKPLTAMAVAMLVEQGRLRLDLPVAEVIPEFGVGGKAAICVRHLLNHTAGFRSADRVPDNLPWDETIKAICAIPREPDWEPGKRAGYQLFSSWFILGEMVHRTDPGRRTIDQLVREEIFVPAGMEDCWMGLPPEEFAAYGDRLGLMHFLSQETLRPHPRWNDPAAASVVRPGGNVRGPIRALGHFYEMLLGFRSRMKPLTSASAETAGLVRRETLATFTRPSRGGLFDETFRHIMDWGLGLE
jgi:CubicO group peptidase (beta-lactamase class C family)